MATRALPCPEADRQEPRFRDAFVVARHVQPMLSGLDHERLVALMLNDDDRLIDQMVFPGSADGIDLCLRRLFTAALAVEARALILAHNHPHGDPTPSSADIRTTRDCARAGKLLSVALLDHLIFGEHRITSFRGMGLL